MTWHANSWSTVWTLYKHSIITIQNWLAIIYDPIDCVHACFYIRRFLIRKKWRYTFKHFQTNGGKEGKKASYGNKAVTVAAVITTQKNIAIAYSTISLEWMDASLSLSPFKFFSHVFSSLCKQMCYNTHTHTQWPCAFVCQIDVDLLWKGLFLLCMPVRVVCACVCE